MVILMYYWEKLQSGQINEVPQSEKIVREYLGMLTKK